MEEEKVERRSSSVAAIGWSVGLIVSTRSANVQTTCIEESSYGWRLREAHGELTSHSFLALVSCLRSCQLGATKAGVGELSESRVHLADSAEALTPDASHV